jgi:hypothetical protein
MSFDLKKKKNSFLFKICGIEWRLFMGTFSQIIQNQAKNSNIKFHFSGVLIFK